MSILKYNSHIVGEGERDGEGIMGNRPVDPPLVFGVIHPPEIEQGLFGVSSLPSPFPSSHGQK